MGEAVVELGAIAGVTVGGVRVGLAVPKGNITGGKFPSALPVNQYADWDMTVHNAGDASGVIAGIVANMDGNPGNVIVKLGTEEHTIAPGYILIIYATKNVCESISIVGQVKFDTVGTYLITLYGGHQEDTSWFADTYAEVTVTVSEAGAVARGVVEAADTPVSASVNEVKPWSFTIHNAGDIGVFGGAVENQPDSPGSVSVTWEGETTEVAPGKAVIVHFVDPQPNCTRLTTSGTIKYPAEGSYGIHLCGVHQEGETWYKDDYKAFTVAVTGAPPGTVSLSGKVTGFLGRPVGGAKVTLNGVETKTNGGGGYSFTGLSPGTYTLVVKGGMWYNDYTVELDMTTPDTEYTKDVALSVKKIILYGVPLSVAIPSGAAIAMVGKPKELKAK